ncbi:MAG: helix-turn-helix domain-containing protein, partial [Undibacterium sp.]|nr:helix-turn-helix domain-containing protein [Undibacterium sp.]
QSQFSAHLLSQKTVQSNIRDLQQWLLSNLHQRLPLPQLAEMAGMSLRNFTRVFFQEVGSSTGDFIAMARLERATQLLAEPHLPLKTIAARCGFGGPDQLRRIFRSRLGMTPQEYRAGLVTPPSALS